MSDQVDQRTATEQPFGDNQIILEFQNRAQYAITAEMARLSRNIVRTLDKCEPVARISVPEIGATIGNLICVWMRNNLPADANWNLQFVKAMPVQWLLPLVEAAEHLDIEELVIYSCHQLAKHVKKIVDN